MYSVLKSVLRGSYNVVIIFFLIKCCTLNLFEYFMGSIQALFIHFPLYTIENNYKYANILAKSSINSMVSCYAFKYTYTCTYKYLCRGVKISEVLIVWNSGEN